MYLSGSLNAGESLPQIPEATQPPERFAQVEEEEHLFRHSVRVLHFDEEEKEPETTTSKQVIMHKRTRPLPPPLSIIEEDETRAPLIDSKIDFVSWSSK